jgi:hypothetical protein
VFELMTIHEARPLIYLRRAIVVLLAVCSVTATCSGYRAYYQVRSLNLLVSSPVLGADSVIETTVITSGRTDVDVRVELVQGQRAETLATRHVPGNVWASIDPRSPRATHRVVVTGDTLARLGPGSAVVRATATGRPQWLRLPPPTVREVVVELKRARHERDLMRWPTLVIELHAGKPFYIDDPGADCLAVGFPDESDDTRFVGLERAYRIDPDDGRYGDGSVSIELGLETPLCGIFPDVIDTVRLFEDKLILELERALRGIVTIRFKIDDSELDRLVTTLNVLFDGTGRLISCLRPAEGSRPDGADV